jgi:hypothetical protein
MTQSNYAILLAQLKLLKEDAPTSDARFSKFYLHLSDHNKKKLSILHAAIGLIMLSKGEIEVKSSIIA